MAKTITLRRVVVTGMGALTPIGNNLSEYWQGLVNGVSGSGLITKFDTTHFKTRFACELKNFQPEHFALERKEIQRMDPYTLYGIIASDEALIHSKLDKAKLNLDRVGVIWGSGIGGLTTLQNETLGYAKNNFVPRFNPFFVPKMIVDMAAGMISMRHQFRGPNYATVSACASSTHAIADAFTAIQLGKADVIVTGGSEAPIVEISVGGFNASKALSENNENYQSASCPFDKDRDGFVMGEGAGCLILEDYEHALKRGATIYAEVVGAAATADAHHLTAPHPEGLGAIHVMQNALKDANLKPEAIDYINVHGTSTPLGDVAELKAITEVFHEHAFELNISATKSMTGHLLGAAGAVEAVASILALWHQEVPPTIHFKTLDPAIDPRFNLTVNKAQKRKINAVLSNTFGFGGHNASVIFQRFEV